MDAGATFRRTIAVRRNGVDFTFSGRTVTLSFFLPGGTPSSVFTSPSSQVTVASDGLSFTMTLDPTTLASLPVSGKYLIEVSSTGGDTLRILEGSVTQRTRG
jgi:hypothetical protein